MNNHCPKCDDYNWERDDKRVHSRPGRFFVICKTCGFSAQATSVKIFTTGAKNILPESVKTKNAHIRYSQDQDDIIGKAGMSPQKAFDWAVEQLRCDV